MIPNKEYKIQILLENFKNVEKTEDCNNLADYVRLEAQSDENLYWWLFEDDYTPEQEDEFEEFLNELRNY